jgi:hypothetical protein
MPGTNFDAIQIPFLGFSPCVGLASLEIVETVGLTVADTFRHSLSALTFEVCVTAPSFYSIFMDDWTGRTRIRTQLGRAGNS